MRRQYGPRTTGKRKLQLYPSRVLGACSHGFSEGMQDSAPDDTNGSPACCTSKFCRHYFCIICTFVASPGCTYSRLLVLAGACSAVSTGLRPAHDPVAR